MRPIDLQQTLKAAGYDPGKLDGEWGPNTTWAVESWFDDGEDIPILIYSPSETSPEPVPPDPATDDQQVMSDEGIEFLVGWEGEKLTAYKDSAGILTIGCGHTSAAGPPTVTAGMTITKEESREILARDLQTFEAGVRKEFGPGTLRQTVFDGAVSFHYNTGAISSASWPDHWKMGDYPTSEKKLKEWNKAGGQVVEGLVKRREAEADCIFRGDYSGRP